jgi:hypothetical protein
VPQRQKELVSMNNCMFLSISKVPRQNTPKMAGIKNSHRIYDSARNTPQMLMPLK